MLESQSEQFTNRMREESYTKSAFNDASVLPAVKFVPLI